MVEVIVLGLTVSESDPVPELLFYVMGSDSVLRLPVSPLEAFALSSVLHSATVLNHAQEQRVAEISLPVVHDVLLECLKHVRGKVERAVISGNWPDYKAELFFTYGRGIKNIACRPGDAVAVAMRAGSSMFIMQDLAKQAIPVEEAFAQLPEHVRAIARAALPTQEEIEVAKKRVADQKTPRITISLVRQTDPKITITPVSKNTDTIVIPLEEKTSSAQSQKNTLTVQSSKVTLITDSDQPISDTQTAEEEKLEKLLQNMTPETKVPM